MKKRFKRRAVWVFILFVLYSAVGFSQDTANDDQTPATRLDSIRTASTKNYLDIYLEADGAIKDYKAFTKDDPARIVFDLYGIKSRHQGLQKVKANDIRARGIRYQVYQNKVRVVVDTEQQYLAQFRVIPVAGGLQIRIGDASVPQPQQTPAAAARAKASTIAANTANHGPTQATHLDLIRTTSRKNYLDIYLEADSAIKDYKVFTLDDPADGPPRIVLDLYGIQSRLKGPQKLPVEDMRARMIRYHAHPDKVRVVVDTEQQYLAQYRVMPVAGGLQIRIGKESVKASQESAAVTSNTEASVREKDTDSGQQPVVAQTPRDAPPSSSTAPSTGEVVVQESDADALIELLMQKGVISEQETGKLQKKARKPSPSTLGEEPVIHIVPDVPEGEKQKIIKEITDKSREDIKRLEQKTATQSEDIMQRQRMTERDVEKLERKLSDVNEKVYKSEWAQRVRFGGDIRLRYEGIGYDGDNALLLDPNDPDSLLNTTEDRGRFRYRVRLSAKAKIIDPRSSDVNVGKVDVGLRLVTGNDDTPVSTNDTFGGYWMNRNVVFDRAYLRYTYTSEEPVWGNNIPQMMLAGGRIPNPWFHTDLVWDPDLNFEGLALNFATDTQDMTKLKGFLTAGAFPLQEDAFTSGCDKYLYAGQVGMEYKPRYDFAARLGIAYYDYVNIEGKLSPASQPTKNECTAPLFFQKGNTLFDIDPRATIEPALASDYNLINITCKIDLGMFHPVHINLIGDYVKNIGFDKDTVQSRTGTDVDRETSGYQLGIEVGHPVVRNFLDWDVFLYYKYLEADAVVDAFTDSDFHNGGTNAKGWILGGNLGLYHNVWARIRWLTSDEIEGPPLAIDTVQIDINARF